MEFNFQTFTFLWKFGNGRGFLQGSGWCRESSVREGEELSIEAGLLSGRDSTLLLDTSSLCKLNVKKSEGWGLMEGPTSPLTPILHSHVPYGRRSLWALEDVFALSTCSFWSACLIMAGLVPTGNAYVRWFYQVMAESAQSGGTMYPNQLCLSQSQHIILYRSLLVLN